MSTETPQYQCTHCGKILDPRDVRWDRLEKYKPQVLIHAVVYWSKFLGEEDSYLCGPVEPVQEHRTAIIDLTSCSKACPFFKAMPGLGHCDDSCKCVKVNKLIHNYRDDYNGKFPQFCPLTDHKDMQLDRLEKDIEVSLKEKSNKKIHCLNIDSSCDYRTWNWCCKRPKLDCASQKVG